jgi:microcystin degradation protein MlrC
MRVLSAHIGHETNTFAVTPTTLEDFRRSSPIPSFDGGDALLNVFRGTGTIHGGFIAGAEENGFALVPLLFAWATPSGTVRQADYEYLKGLLLERIRSAGEYDGILLDLHGAMATEALEDAEGDLISAVRDLAGAEIPIIVTLDLHANATEKMARSADSLIGFDEYPHTDMFERGKEAAAMMARALSREWKPVMAYRQLPLLTMPPKQCTFLEPMLSLLAKAHAMEDEEGVLNVTLSLGFPFADIHDAGVSVMVTTNGDEALARAKAEEMAQAIWDRRDEFNVTLTPVSEAIRYAETEARGPVILADGSDNPGGGGPCDGTVLLRALIELGAKSAVVAVIADPEAVAAAAKAGVGQRITLDLGGKTDDRHGEPVRVTAHVRLLSDGEFLQTGSMGKGTWAEMGRAAVLVIGESSREGVEVVVTERRIQPLDAALLRSVGIEPTERRIIALKSAVHFRSTYQDFSDRIFDMDTPGVHRPDFANYEYRRLRRPLYPVSE